MCASVIGVEICDEAIWTISGVLANKIVCSKNAELQLVLRALLLGTGNIPFSVKIYCICLAV